MRAGNLNSRIEIQDWQSVGQNAKAETEKAWITVWQPWAEITDLNGRETYSGQQLRSDITHQVRIRYRQGITPAHRVKFGDRVLTIQSVTDPDNSGEMLLLSCIEVASNG